jgi:hypothetical protein
MTTDSIWDNPEMKVGGDYIKFENVGDTITGTVLSVGAHKWDDGTVSPQVLLETPEGEEKTITAGQIRLKAALAEKRPEVGDTLTVTYTELEKRQGGKTLKHFAVDVVKGSGGGFKSAPISQATSADDALANMDPAVVEALRSKLGATPF